MVLLVKKMGRAKIPITWIKSDASRHVTFTKRKKGLKKKVEELAILCGVEVCMICFSPQGSMIKPSNNSNDADNINTNTPTSTSTMTTTTTNPTSNGSPYSWGLPGVGHVINKYRSLSKEEQDKKKLDNTSLLEQQIKKLKSEVRLKMEENESKESERAYLLWDDRLNSYGVDELGQLADIIVERTREVYEKIESLVMMNSGDLYVHHHNHQPPQRQEVQILEGGTDFHTHMNGPGNLLYDDEGMMMMMMDYHHDSQRGSLDTNGGNPPRFTSFLGGSHLRGSISDEIDEANLGKYNSIINQAPQVNPFNSVQAFAANINPLYTNSVIENGLVLNHQNPPSYLGNNSNHQYGLLDQNIPLLSLVNHEYNFNSMEDGKSILPMPSSTPPSNSIYIDGSPMLMQGGECIGDHNMLHANDHAANASLTSQLTSPLIKLKDFIYLQPELEQGDVNADNDNEVNGGGGALGSSEDINV